MWQSHYITCKLLQYIIFPIAAQQRNEVSIIIIPHSFQLHISSGLFQPKCHMCHITWDSSLAQTSDQQIYIILPLTLPLSLATKGQLFSAVLGC